ncbi:DUF6436 domain-containing protein [Pseudocolwellia sp. HL-MZ19]|uniref:DUF6436 domain-containing protein n=1 Tax=unclassified Pseudocolwellia TaxID=2848178 RepID=UPI003CE83E46
MPTSSNPNPQNGSKTEAPLHLYIIVFVWLGFTVLAAAYFITDRLVAFDPSQKLNNMSQNALVEKIKAEFELPNNLSNTLINFVSENCRCNQTSSSHLSDVKMTAERENMSVINVVIPDNFSGIIPSTPAVLALDHNSELIYFGPYSEGLSCGSGEGIIDLVMSNYKKGFNAKLIMTSTEGCYCNI